MLNGTVRHQSSVKLSCDQNLVNKIECFDIVLQESICKNICIFTLSKVQYV
jgi:hypothetical protein